MDQFIWHIYAYVYDLILPELSPYQQMIRRVYEALDPRNGECYLDAGCGTGNYLLPVLDSENDLTLVGVDYSNAMLKRAQKKLRSREEKVDLYELDLNKNLPFDKEVFNGVNCINVLYAIKTPEFAIQELYRVLNNGGRMVLITPLDEPEMLPILKEHLSTLKANHPKLWGPVFFYQLIKFFIPALIFVPINIYIKSNKKYHFFSEEEIRLLLTSNGFRIHEIGLIYGQQNWFIVAEKTRVNA